MIQTTVVLAFDSQDRILLCMKKRGFGEGLWNGPGGKVKGSESLSQCAVRELFEEVGISAQISDLQLMGTIAFHFIDRPEWDQDMAIYTLYGVSQSPSESDEMRPEWFEIGEIPYSQMWEADKIWVPRVIRGEEIAYSIRFKADGTLIDSNLIR